MLSTMLGEFEEGVEEQAEETEPQEPVEEAPLDIVGYLGEKEGRDTQYETGQLPKILKNEAESVIKQTLIADGKLGAAGGPRAAPPDPKTLNSLAQKREAIKQRKLDLGAEVHARHYGVLTTPRPKYLNLRALIKKLPREYDDLSHPAPGAAVPPPGGEPDEGGGISSWFGFGDDVAPPTTVSQREEAEGEEAERVSTSAAQRADLLGTAGLAATQKAAAQERGGKSFRKPVSRMVGLIAQAELAKERLAHEYAIEMPEVGEDTASGEPEEPEEITLARRILEGGEGAAAAPPGTAGTAAGTAVEGEEAGSGASGGSAAPGDEDQSGSAGAGSRAGRSSSGGAGADGSGRGTSNTKSGFDVDIVVKAQGFEVLPDAETSSEEDEEVGVFGNLGSGIGNFFFGATPPFVVSDETLGVSVNQDDGGFDFYTIGKHTKNAGGTLLSREAVDKTIHPLGPFFAICVVKVGKTKQKKPNWEKSDFSGPALGFSLTDPSVVTPVPDPMSIPDTWVVDSATGMGRLSSSSAADGTETKELARTKPNKASDELLLLTDDTELCVVVDEKTAVTHFFVNNLLKWTVPTQQAFVDSVQEKPVFGAAHLPGRNISECEWTFDALDFFASDFELLGDNITRDRHLFRKGNDEGNNVIVSERPLPPLPEGIYFEVVLEEMGKTASEDEDGLCMGVTALRLEAPLPDACDVIPKSWVVGFEGIAMCNAAATFADSEEDGSMKIAEGKFKTAKLKAGDRIGLLLKPTSDYEVLVNGEVAFSDKFPVLIADAWRYPLYPFCDLMGNAKCIRLGSTVVPKKV